MIVVMTTMIANVFRHCQLFFEGEGAISRKDKWFVEEYVITEWWWWLMKLSEVLKVSVAQWRVT